MTFLAVNGEMAQRIRDIDWDRHPIGPISDWPQALRSALGICLNSAFPTAIYWGSQLRLFYNDAWAPIPGPRHPDALGKPAQEVWSDIWHIIEPQFSQVIRTGQGLFVEDQLLPMKRYGVPEETYWSYSFTPIRGSEGDIVGIFNSGSETTREVIDRRQSAFLLEYSDALHAAAPTANTLVAALERLGRYLGAECVGLCERSVEHGARAFPVTEEWIGAGLRDKDSCAELFGLWPTEHERLMAGATLRLSTQDSSLPPEVRARMDEAGLSAALAVPMTGGGRALSVLYACWTEPGTQAFDDTTVAMLRKLLEATTTWLERERNAAREKVLARELDHRARNLLAVMTGITRLTKAEDVATFRAELVDRISSLARAHGLLSRKRWIDLTLTDVVEEEVALVRDTLGDAVRSNGPRVPLTADQAQPLAMVLHEMITNAVRQSGLAGSASALSIDWSVALDGTLNLGFALARPAGQVAGAGESGDGFDSELVQRIVEDQLFGRIEHGSGGDGFLCRISVPLQDPGPPATEMQATPTRGGRPSVLVVEDEIVVAMDLAETLREIGYEVFGTVASVDAGLQALENGSPDLALLDANLRGQSASPIARALALRGIPFLVVSGYDADSEIEGELAARPRLSKPVAQDDLAAELAQLSGRA